jgi:hypothetical protein
MLDRCPFAGNCHKISFHSIGEACFIQWWLDDSRRLTTDHHGETLADTFHLLQNVILTHEINHSDNQFHGVLVNTNQNGIIKDVDDGEEQSILGIRQRRGNVSFLMAADVCEQQGNTLTLRILM